jgi:predicted phosphodiesterase
MTPGALMNEELSKVLSVRLGVVADIHGNAAALEAVLADARGLGVDAWWALGDLVLFGPRPVEVLEILASLPEISYVSGNTDRYVVTGGQPEPHRTVHDVAGDAALVARFAGMASAIGWTQGALAQGSGLLEQLSALPGSIAAEHVDGERVLGVHASPGHDDGPGIDNSSSNETLVGLIGEAAASVVVGGHTHDPTDRMVGTTRALNPGSVGLPRQSGHARWLLLELNDHGIDTDLRRVPFNVAAVVEDLKTRRYPIAPFLEGILTGKRAFVS